MDWPISNKGGFSNYSDMGIAAPTSINTKGPWTQMVAATAAEVNFIVVSPIYYYYNNIGYLFDVGIGAAGSEVVIINNLNVGTASSYAVRTPNAYGFPVHISKGQRVSIRQQNESTQYLGVSIDLYSTYPGMTQSFAGVDSLGVDTSTTRGTNIDPGGVASTFGNYYQLTAATSRTYKAIMISSPYDHDSSRSDTRWTIRVAVGDAGSEVDIGSLNVWCNAYNDVLFPRASKIIPVIIPKGSRISARCSSVNTTVDDRNIDVICYAIY